MTDPAVARAQFPLGLIQLYPSSAERPPQTGTPCPGTHSVGFCLNPCGALGEIESCCARYFSRAWFGAASAMAGEQTSKVTATINLFFSMSLSMIVGRDYRLLAHRRPLLSKARRHTLHD